MKDLDPRQQFADELRIAIDQRLVEVREEQQLQNPLPRRELTSNDLDELRKVRERVQELREELSMQNRGINPTEEPSSF